MVPGAEAFMRTVVGILGLAYFTLAGAGCVGSSTVMGSNLRVTRAVLYQNGIGYFERRGKVDDDLLRIRVRPDQIRDVLKSLTIVDLSDGRPVSIALPIEKSRLKQLSDLPEQVRTQGGILALAQAFRGARCEITGGTYAKGRLVGVENLGSDDKPDWRVSVLAEGGAIRQVRVPEIRDLKILDGTLEVGLTKALDVALDAGSWKPVELAVRLSGKAPHNLVVSYVVEMPTWKPAYRLVVGKDGKSLLQGWAVVDNVSGDDWRDVKLSLTAGTPLAFTYDLYTPRFPRRPNLVPRDAIADIPLDALQAQSGVAMSESPPEPTPAAAPMALEKSVGGHRGEGGGGEYKKKGKRSAARPSDGDGLAEDSVMAPPPPAVSVDQLERNFRSMVAGAAVGSLFRYDLEEPVTIAERQSALVNVINAKVPGEDVLLFRVGADSVSPYRAVRFKNDSGLVLEAGPIAIYQTDASGGTFLGEALASRIEKTANTFVPYAVDGRVRLTLSEETKEEGVTLVKIVRGVITVQTKMVTRYAYDVDNASDETATLYVRRERRTGWTLTKKDQVLEEGGAYYLPIKLPKTGRTKVVVEEQSPLLRSVDIWNDFGRQVIGLYLSSSTADPTVAAGLKEALKLREKADALSAQISTLEEQGQTLRRREEEVRENIKALGKNSKNVDLKTKLEKTLGELETQLNDVTRKSVAMSIERGETNDRLAVVMKSISLESK